MLIKRLLIAVLLISYVPSLGLCQANWQPFTTNRNNAAVPTPVGGAEAGSVTNPAPPAVLGDTPTVVNGPIFSLAPPANPNLMFGNAPKKTIGPALRVPQFGMEGGLPVVYGNATVAAQGAIAYDTGYVGSGMRLFPSTIALDGTDVSRRRGRTQLSAEATQLAITLAPNSNTESGARADFQLDFFDGVQLRIAKGQVAVGNGILYAGKTWTTFMDEYAVPMSIAIDTTAAGTVFKRLAQIGYAFPIYGSPYLQGFLAVEEPTGADYFVNPTDERIERYPTLVGRLHWANCRDWRHNSTLHLAGMVRGMGREDAAFMEDLTAGWGVSLMGKLRPFRSSRHTFYAGGVVGEGIGNYLFGLSHHAGPTPLGNQPAAFPIAGNLTALRNYGAHVGYTRHWNACADTSFGYGYAFAESVPGMRDDATRMLQNGWVNHQVKLTELLAIGAEYHYAIRDVRDKTEGDNHRVLFVVQLLTN